MAHSLAAANFAMLLAIASKAQPNQYDQRGIVCSLLGIFSMLAVGLVITGCLAHRKIPWSFPLVIYIGTMLGILATMTSLEALLRPINEYLKFATLGMFILILLVLFNMISQLKNGRPIDAADEDPNFTKTQEPNEKSEMEPPRKPSDQI